MCEPRYRDPRAKEIPHVRHDNDKVLVKVISGESGGVKSQKGLTYTPIWYLDIEIQPGGKLVQPVPKGWNAFAYVFKGFADFSDNTSSSERAMQFDAVMFHTKGDAIAFKVPASAVEADVFSLLQASFWTNPSFSMVLLCSGAGRI
ncbi:hypothetical protein ACHAQH_008951 [Verticillium albo-atrum]